MTTIACDGRILAADTMMTLGNERIYGVQKIKVRDGRAYAISGIGAMLDPLIDWHVAGHVALDAPKLGGDETWSLLVINAVGKLSYFTNTAPYPLAVPAPFAMGSGQDYAMGMMKGAGKTAVQAVEFCCKQDLYTGGEVHAVNLVNMAFMTDSGAIKHAAGSMSLT